MSAPAVALQPIKASLVADLVDLVNLNLGRIVKESAVVCRTCNGDAVIGNREDRNELTCPDCGGVGAVADYVLDMEALQTPRIGRLIEQWEMKQGRLVPKFRGKTQAFAQLAKILGFDKAVLEVTGAVPFADSLSQEARQEVIDTVRDLAQRGLL